MLWRSMLPLLPDNVDIIRHGSVKANFFYCIYIQGRIAERRRCAGIKNECAGINLQIGSAFCWMYPFRRLAVSFWNFALFFWRHARWNRRIDWFCSNLFYYGNISASLDRKRRNRYTARKDWMCWKMNWNARSILYGIIASYQKEAGSVSSSR